MYVHELTVDLLTACVKSLLLAIMLPSRCCCSERWPMLLGQSLRNCTCSDYSEGKTFCPLTSKNYAYAAASDGEADICQQPVWKLLQPCMSLPGRMPVALVPRANADYEATTFSLFASNPICPPKPLNLQLDTLQTSKHVPSVIPEMPSQYQCITLWAPAADGTKACGVFK